MKCNSYVACYSYLPSVTITSFKRQFLFLPKIQTMHPFSNILNNNELPWTRIHGTDGKSPRTHTVQMIDVFEENGNGINQQIRRIDPPFV